jgi:hypothetical protein
MVPCKIVIDDIAYDDRTEMASATMFNLQVPTYYLP